jgi:STE24 endopeptidase
VVQDPSRVSIDAERQRLAEEYARIRLWLGALSLCISIGAIILLGPAGLAVGLRDAVRSATGVWPLEVALFFLILGGLWGVIKAPLVYVSSFRLPHRYGLSNQTFGQWSADVAKGAALGTLIAGAAVEVLYGFLRATPDTWWIWTGIAFTLLTVGLSAVSPVVILPLFFKLQPIGDDDLVDRIRRLARSAGTNIRDVRHINLSSKTPAANAAVIGLGRTRKIVLGDTLTSSFPVEEVEVVVAHELGHHVHRDIAKGLSLEAVSIVSGFFVTNLALHAATRQWGFAGVWDLGLFAVLAAVLGLWGTASGIVSRALSRRMESAADAYSLVLTGQGEAFVNSEIRLTNQNLAWLRPPDWVETLLYTHPAPWRRIAMGETYLAHRPLER